MNFLQNRNTRKHTAKQITNDFTLKEMCQMMLIQSSHEIAMQKEEMKNEMEMHCQEWQ